VPPAPTGQRRLANGMQIFSGGVPIYRGTTLVGAIGVSGDGIDQDDMIGFLGSNNGGARSAGSATRRGAMRADTVVVAVGARGAAALRQLPVRAVPRHHRQTSARGSRLARPKATNALALLSMRGLRRRASPSASPASAARRGAPSASASTEVRARQCGSLRLARRRVERAAGWPPCHSA
jgi:hypothetical protein